MKRPPKTQKKTIKHRRINHLRNSQLGEDRITDLLKVCLQRVCELQADLQRNEPENNPEAAGYAACAIETLRFLTAEGVAPDNPIFKALAEKFLTDNEVTRQ